MVRNAVVKIFSEGKLPDPLYYLCGRSKDTVNIKASVEGVVITIFQIGASNLLSFSVRAINTFFTFRCGCHTRPRPLNAGFVTVEM